MTCASGNLDYCQRVAEMDKRIETILFRQLTHWHIFQVWCSEFNQVDDGDARRDVPLRDITNKRMKEKVGSGFFFLIFV